MNTKKIQNAIDFIKSNGSGLFGYFTSEIAELIGREVAKEYEEAGDADYQKAVAYVIGERFGMFNDMELPMKKWLLILDVRGSRNSKAFYKIIEAGDYDEAKKRGQAWFETMNDEIDGDDFPERDEMIDEYTGEDHEVGDSWEEEIDVDY